MTSTDEELHLCHLSCESWLRADLWAGYFAEVERILGAAVTHLDQRDPVRRKAAAGAYQSLGEYVVAIGAKESSRWLFGKMKSIDVKFMMQLRRDGSDSPSAIDWYFPSAFLQKPDNVDAVRRLFACGNRALAAFYGVADLVKVMSGKKKQSGGIDLEAELLGVYWLTYFCEPYIHFIGRERFERLSDCNVLYNPGATLDLAAAPHLVPDGVRLALEAALSPTLFVDPKETTPKRPGEYSLTFDQIRRGMAQPSTG